MEAEGSYQCECPEGMMLYDEEDDSDISFDKGGKWHLEHSELLINRTCVCEWVYYVALHITQLVYLPRVFT